MTQNEFVTLCLSYSVDPNIALENETIVELLRDIKNATNKNAKNEYRNLLIRTFETEF